MRIRLAFLALLITLSVIAAPTRNNDDSCDISVMPAATLLLPYFEVSPSGSTTTVFTVTNVGPQEQIAHVTLWTDYAYPVVDFNLYLTGYDMQSINLHDVIFRGVIGSEAGTGPNLSHDGNLSTGNPRLDLSECANLPGTIPAALLPRMQSAFQLGRVAAAGTQTACNTVGGTHTNAVGYATIDVVQRCTSRTAINAGYVTEDLLWDNVLMGDYQTVDLSRSVADGEPMVHLRAISEGGTRADRRNYPGQYEVAFKRTFYSRYQPLGGGLFGTFDARQPLPSAFAARWIGTISPYGTNFKIWREGIVTAGAVACAAWPNNDSPIVECVIFDEEENPEGAAPSEVITPITTNFILAATSRTSVRDTTVFPRPTAGSFAGWVYMNFDNNPSDAVPSQNWVITSMRAYGLFSVDSTAYSLANGCTPAPYTSEVNVAGGQVIGPAIGTLENTNP